MKIARVQEAISRQLKEAEKNSNQSHVNAVGGKNSSGAWNARGSRNVDGARNASVARGGKKPKLEGEDISGETRVAQYVTKLAGSVGK